MAARMQEGGREEGKICCFLAFVICTIWSVIWVFVGVFVHAAGTNVEIVGQVGLFSTCRESVNTAASDHANSTETLRGEMQQLSTLSDYHSESSESLFSLWCFFKNRSK